MRFASVRTLAGVAVALFLTSAAPRSAALSTVHQRRLAMGTMFEVVAYHPSRPDAESAVAKALDEVVRLDQVMSDYKPDSDLSRLVRDARRGLVSVEPSLYEIIQESLAFSARSGGTFDVTIAPLLRAWQRASAEGRRPADAEIARAKRCVGYEKIETVAPDRIRFRSDCVEIDLGGIGKGYAVDRAMAVLKAARIEHAAINAGRSSIAAIGAPPGQQGWPVTIGDERAGGRVVLLRNNSISTSQQNLVRLQRDEGEFGEILDPHTGAPALTRMSVSVIAPRAMVSDALDTTLVLLSMEESRKLLAQFTGVSAFWVSPNGSVHAAYANPTEH